jgi:hypothetical protein
MMELTLEKLPEKSNGIERYLRPFVFAATPTSFLHIIIVDLCSYNWFDLWFGYQLFSI